MPLNEKYDQILEEWRAIVYSSVPELRSSSPEGEGNYGAIIFVESSSCNDFLLSYYFFWSFSGILLWNSHQLLGYLPQRVSAFAMPFTPLREH